MKSLLGCDIFLSKLYSACTTSEAAIGGWLFWVLLLCGCLLCAWSLRGKAGGADSNQLKSRRDQLMAQNAAGLGAFNMTGHYTENGETKPTSYCWAADAFGNLRGSAADDDGSAQLEGKLCWRPGEPFGEIAWRETSHLGPLEAHGNIGFEGPPGQPRYLTIRATYSSALGVSGVVQLRSQQPVSDSSGEARANYGPIVRGYPAGGYGPIVQGTVVSLW